MGHTVLAAFLFPIIVSFNLEAGTKQLVKEETNCLGSIDSISFGFILGSGIGEADQRDSVSLKLIPQTPKHFGGRSQWAILDRPYKFALPLHCNSQCSPPSFVLL